MDKNLVVRYKNEINRASHYLDVIEQRIILSSIAKVPKGEVTDEKIYYVSAEDLIALGTNKKLVYGQMKEAADTLFNRYITLTREDAEFGHTVRKFRWVQTVEYQEGSGRIGLRFSRDLLPFITNLQEQFTRFGLLDLMGLTSSYAIRFYGMLMQFVNTGKLVIKVDDLRERLELGTKFKMYADLKKYVIEKAVDQINAGKRTQIKVKYKEKKIGRKVDTLIFTMVKKNQIIDVDGTVIDNATADMFTGLSRDDAELSESQLKMYADFLSGTNKRYEGVAHRFFEYCQKEKLLDGLSGITTVEFRAKILGAMRNPDFVIAIYPWLKEVGFRG